ncbi:MAG: hypothetical protein ACRENX_03700 [Candidatus Dormibacteria bacterium]
MTTQDEQVDCFRNVAAHLVTGGYFVLRESVPELQRLPPSGSIQALAIAPPRLGFEEYGVATQIAFSHHYRWQEGIWRPSRRRFATSGHPSWI